MLTSYFTRWFSRPALEAAPGERPPVAVLPLPAPRAPRFPTAAPAVAVAVSHTCEGLLIRVKGEARVDCVGVLLAGLLAPSALRPAVVTLDLSELRCLSSLAMGALVAYRRGVVRTGGRVRLVEQLQPGVREALARAELLDLFEPDAGNAVPAAGLQAGRAPAA